MTRCAQCGEVILFGGTELNGKRFCSPKCVAAGTALRQQAGFCERCTLATTEASAGGTFVMNGFGTRLYGSSEPCGICGSVQQTKFVTALYVPLIPLGAYRVKYLSARRYLSRKVR